MTEVICIRTRARLTAPVEAEPTPCAREGCKRKIGPSDGACYDASGDRLFCSAGHFSDQLRIDVERMQARAAERRRLTEDVQNWRRSWKP